MPSRSALEPIQEPHSSEVNVPMSSTLKNQTTLLLRQYHLQPSPALRNRLVELNLGLVRKEAHHWRHQCQESYEDLVQIGCLGLIQAIERFDLTRGLAFSSFAMPYIRGEIQHYLRDKSPAMRIPRRWLGIQRQAKRVVQELRQELGRQPTEHEVRERLGLTPEEWQEMRVAHQNSALLSLDAPVAAGDMDASSLGDLVPDHNYRSFQLALEDQVRLRMALDQLEKKTRTILEFVFLYDLTQKETAERMGISAVTVSRQVKKGLLSLSRLLQKDIF
ncbi:MAG: RNA polymerase sigma factor SigF [Synechococcales cyanobacterium]